MSRCSADYGVYIWKYNNKYIVIVNLSTDDFLVATKNEEARTLIENTIKKYFKVTSVRKNIFHYLNWRIIQSTGDISINQTEHIKKLLRGYF